MPAATETPISPGNSTGVACVKLVRFWKCWTNNCRSRLDHGLYITHACTDTGSRTLCGVRFQEFADEITPDNGIGCLKCRRIMSNAEVRHGAKDADLD